MRFLLSLLFWAVVIFAVGIILTVAYFFWLSVIDEKEEHDGK